nr:hypothetical protein HCAJSMRY_HCAJSMRY_CDS_0007 [Microvirus sp.]
MNTRKPPQTAEGKFTSLYVCNAPKFLLFVVDKMRLMRV